MNNTQLLEKTDSFVGAQWLDRKMPPPVHTLRPFVTISRESGAGGSGLARLLARALNAEAPPDISWSVFDGMITTRMLRDHHLPSHIARFLPEDRMAELNSAVGELVGLHPNLWDLVEKTNATLRRLAQDGHVVLVGRGAAFATASSAAGVHVRLVAPPAQRAKNFCELYGMPEPDALALNAKRDAAARRYVRATFNADIEDPQAYDLVINTARVTLDQATQLVLAQVHARLHAAPTR
ncbi:MAG: cytidylate kinase family protein [Opitutaceae bacterium]